MADDELRILRGQDEAGEDLDAWEVTGYDEFGREVNVSVALTVRTGKYQYHVSGHVDDASVEQTVNAPAVLGYGVDSDEAIADAVRAAIAFADSEEGEDMADEKKDVAKAVDRLLSEQANGGLERVVDELVREQREPEIRGDVKYHRHPNGGGLVADTAKVADTAFVGVDARVSDGAQVSRGARIVGHAQVYGNAVVSDDAVVSEGAWVFDGARVVGRAWLYGDAVVSGNAQVSDNAEVSGNAQVSDDAVVSGRAQVSDDAEVSGNARVFGDAEVYGNARVSGDEDISTGEVK